MRSIYDNRVQQVDWSQGLAPGEEEAYFAALERGHTLTAAAELDVVLDGQLARIDVSVLDADQAVALLAEVERVRSRSDALQQQLLSRVAADIEDRDRATHGEQIAQKQYYVEEIAAVLRVSGRTAADRICQAQLLVEHLPETVERMRAGRVSLLQARMIYQALEPVIAELSETEAHELATALQEQLTSQLGERPQDSCGRKPNDSSTRSHRSPPSSGTRTSTRADTLRCVPNRTRWPPSPSTPVPMRWRTSSPP